MRVSASTRRYDEEGVLQLSVHTEDGKRELVNHPTIDATLSPELPSDHAIDANVRLPPRTQFESEDHPIGEQRPHTSARRERAFA